MLNFVFPGAAAITLLILSSSSHAENLYTPNPLQRGFVVAGPRALLVTFDLEDRYQLKQEDGVTTAKLDTLTYRLPLPDFTVTAGVATAGLLVNTAVDPVTVAVNGHALAEAKCPTLPIVAARQLCAHAKLLQAKTTARELVITFAADTQPTGQRMTLLVTTTSPMMKTLGWTTRDLSETTPMPTMVPLLDYPLRDTSLRPGADGMFYLTGSTGAPDMWAVTSDIQLWKSQDLQSWTPVITKPRARSVVWSIDRDGTWEKKMHLRDGAPFRPLWAPEIHYLKGTYWIPYSIPFLGTGLLKSSTGKPEGPYVSALKVDAPLTTGIDASLFEDDDGSVYFLWAGGMIARMLPDLSGLAEPGRQLRPTNAPLVGFEGSSIIKWKGRYYLSAADWTGGDYNCFTASANSIYGPYTERYLSVPHGGHNNFFQDKKGQWWSTFFGSDARAPFQERPAIVPMHFDEHGELKPVTKK